MAYQGRTGFATTPNLDDGELWLPSGFLGDVAESKMTGPKNCGQLSVVADEEDDYMAGLAESVAYAMLDDDDDDENCEQSAGFGSGGENRVFAQQAAFKGSAMARSPQFTLTGLERFGGHDREEALALFNMAAEQVVRLNAVGFEHGRGNNGGHYEMSGQYLQASQFPSQLQLSHNILPSRNDFTDVNAELCYGSPQMASQRVSNPRPYVEVAKGCPQSRTRCASNPRPINRPSPRLVPGHMGGGSGMRAVFLGSNGPGRESGGTGFFLPRRMDNKGSAAKPQPKPACSTVLLPARIVQALNLNVEDLRSNPYVYVRKNEKRRSVGGDGWQQQHQQQRVGFNPGCYEAQLPGSDISLPNEWTY
ncbi:hypothetical protein SUGI_1195790 [Cryptomeria japonica]|uniref:uncharacterized protein LOC131065117 n=1 Tax=Cryptomeria japonica TaxID=3369 RepID=UPI0024146C91|nr:uncharacterized protein LOC131065117 [Cryptomeria japonica]GLJ55672.1 hypothetical protein SUGI_1195790 [Cryptomeria japonica]